MNVILATVAAAILGSAPPPGRGAEPVLVGERLNPQTTLLIAPTSGQALIAIDTGGVLLIADQSPSLALPLTDANGRPTSGVTLFTGLR